MNTVSEDSATTVSSIIAFTIVERLGYCSGVSEQGEEGAQRFLPKGYAMINTRDGRLTWILWELRQTPCHIIDEQSSDCFAEQHVECSPE